MSSSRFKYFAVNGNTLFAINELPIMKFNLQKPVRVCQLCNDVLTLGVMAAR